jgi:putative Flp pilus-assembly TadE/G-like protein
MRMIERLSRPNGPDERGATAVIVALSLIAILGMVVLTVDVGQLLFKRRAMVNASDAGALAAAQSCAGLTDSDSPESMADAFAIDNVSGLVAGNGGITDVAGCDGPPFGYVTVQYQIPQELFFAGVLGFDGPATVRTRATAGWGPAGGANPIPIVVYTGTTQTQGECRIEENLPPGESCFLWYDNNKDVFGGSAFGFLNLCPEGDPLCSKVGWDVSGGASCPNVGASERRPWIDGTWGGGPNNVNYPAPTYVCRLSGLASNLWTNNLEGRVGDDLTFPVNDCATQVDKNGNAVGCSSDKVDKYNIIGFIVLQLDAVLDSKAEWGGNAGSCTSDPVNMTVTSPNIDLDILAPGLGCTPYDTIENVKLNAPGNPKCCTENTHFLYDPDTHVVDWIGAVRDNVRISWDYAEGGPCGVPPNNSSAVCLQVHTVEVQFGGLLPGQGANYNLRAVRLCDLAIGSCPRDS